MPITIGQKPESSFSDPLGLLTDCHRRIEHFLDLLTTVTKQSRGGDLNTEQRNALETALRYFREAAPNHTRDEEESLFPRMRASKDRNFQTAFATLDALEADHVKAKQAHDEIEALGRKWLSEGRLPSESVERMSRILTDLRKAYERHIAIEDSAIFPLAGKVLNKAEFETVGRKMAARRGVKPKESA